MTDQDCTVACIRFRRSLLGGSPLTPRNINPFIGPSVAIPFVRCRGTLIFADEKKTDRRVK